jgi:aminoglycoside phosphotransferase (APT) family kinase protein
MVGNVLSLAMETTDDQASGPPDVGDMQRSSRDPETLRTALEHWLAGRLPGGAQPAVTDLHATSANGMSSETILFDAAWTEDGAPRQEGLVARLAPDLADVPVFPSYDLQRQFDVIRAVGELTAVPVPRVWWMEPRPDAVGTPFFVMERIDGDVPPDVMPYNFGDSWLSDAEPVDQRRLQDATVTVLAHLHTLDGDGDRFAFLAFDDPGDTPLRRHVAHARAWYEFACADGLPSPLIERGFAWLDDHWPDDEGPTVVCWGDSRVGNVMYRDFEPVGVFDWEMAGLGPCELDVAWLLYGHRFFEDLAHSYGLPGMPGFLRPGDVSSTYEALTGRAPRNLEFFQTYAAIQWAIVGQRTGRRQVHFGEREMPADGDELCLNRAFLEAMLDGTYEWEATR